MSFASLAVISGIPSCVPDSLFSNAEDPAWRGLRDGDDRTQVFSAANSAGSGISIGPSFGVPIRIGLPNGSRSPQSVP